MRTHYAHLVDVLRKYNPQLTEQALDNHDYIGNDDTEQVIARIGAVESQWDDLTRNPYREVRVGETERPATWEVKRATLYRTQGGVKFWLNNRDVTPLDSAEGDRLELRIGRDAWKDITDDEGNRWEADYTKGWLRVYFRYYKNYYRTAVRDRSLRVTYRHGAPGGGPHKAGQTELTSNASDTDSQFDVADATRIPAEGVVFVGGTEYVHITGRDAANDTITVTRGVRGTTASSHDSGETVHYCPLDIRDAVAAKAAVELLTYEDWVDELIEAGGYNVRDKIEQWENEFDKIAAKHSEVRSV